MNFLCMKCRKVPFCARNWWKRGRKNLVQLLDTLTDLIDYLFISVLLLLEESEKYSMGCLHQVDIKRRSLTWYTARSLCPLLQRWGCIIVKWYIDFRICGLAKSYFMYFLFDGQITSNLKKTGQTAVLYHYCGLSRFFWIRRYVWRLQYISEQ
jgi:hypothetical protein